MNGQMDQQHEYKTRSKRENEKENSV